MPLGASDWKEARGGFREWRTFLDLCAGHTDVLPLVKTVHLGLGNLLYVCFISIKGLLNSKQSKTKALSSG